MEYDPQLVSLIRQIVKSTVTEAVAATRTTGILSGTVEDVDEDLDVVYIRMDRESVGSSPTESDNYGYPGVIPATRLGETFVDEEVRVNWDGSAGASAMRTSVESRIVLPFGAESGVRVVLDGELGQMEFYDPNDNLIGLLSSSRWFVGSPGGALTQLDQFGGLRVRSSEDVLVADLSHQPALTMRDGVTGETRVVLRNRGLKLVDPGQATDVEVTTGGTVTPTPNYRSLTEVNPGTSMVTPATASMTSGDLELRHVVAYHNSTGISSSFTSPPGFTELFDVVDSSAQRSLHVGLAHRQPASPNSNQTFTNSSGAYQQAIGTTVVIRGEPLSGVPSVRSHVEDFADTSAGTAMLSLPKPTGTAENDVLVAFISMANKGGTIPIGWETPPGWIFLGADFLVGSGFASASGVWYKQTTLNEPDDYDVQINFGAGQKRIHASVVAIQNPGFFSTGPGVMVAGRLQPRLIEAREVASNTNGIILSDIPPDFDNLRLVMALQSVGGDSQVSRGVFLEFNGDFGSGRYSYRDDGSLGSEANNSITALRVGSMWTDTSTRASLEVLIPDYSRPSERTTVIGRYTMFANSQTLIGRSGGLWRGTDPVHQIRIRPQGNVTQIRAGSKVWLYGE